MNNLRHYLVVIILIGLSLTCYYYLFNKKEKVGYVELAKLMNEFQMKKELENNVTRVKEKRQAILDSLELELKLISRQLESTKQNDKDKVNGFQVKRESYFEKKKSFEDDIEKITNQYNSQIATQINQYIKDFGSKNNYSLIFGAEGSGALMYAPEERNITNETIKYMNERYAGASK
jgi:outer membrane protein